MPDGPALRGVKSGGWLAWSGGETLVYAAKGNKTAEFYSYDLRENRWAALTPIPPGQDGRLPYKGCRGVADDRGHVYMVYGSNTSTFSRYSAATRTWTELEPIPPQPGGDFAKSGSDMVFVWRTDTGYAYLLKGKGTDFCRYNTRTGQWEVLPSAPAGAKSRYREGSWLVFDGDHTIYCHKAKYHELWRYDIAADRWSDTMLPGFPLVGMTGKAKKSKGGSCAAFMFGRILALKGGNTQEFWCFDTASRAWRERDTLPSVGSTGKRRKVGAGADIVATGFGNVFALKGNRTCECWTRYEWRPDAESPPPAPGPPRGSALGRVSGVASRSVPGLLRGATVRDVTGRIVARNGKMPAGLPAGIYFVRAADPDQVRKLVIVR